MAEVRVLLDPSDDMQVSVGLLEHHDPARGHVVVHPTPGARSLQAFAHDVLDALGRAVNRLDAEQLAGPAAAWRAVTAWMVTGQTGELVVLRADRLTASVWARVLELGRETGTRLLLVCHAPQIPAQMAAVLAGTGHQVLTGLPPVLDSRSAYPHPRPWADAAAGAEADAEDLPRFLYPHIRNYRTKAFDQLGPAGFARTDAVYRHAREAACHWLSTRPAPGPAAASDQSVQLFLAWLVHDSPSRTHTLARLRGAQAGFRLHGFKLDIPPSQWVLDVLSGPGLDAPLVTTQTAGRIRAGVAHPVIAAGIATVLVTGVEPLVSMPWEALSPQNDALRLTWHPPNRRLIQASQVTTRTPPPPPCSTCRPPHGRCCRPHATSAAPPPATARPGGCSPRHRSATSGSRAQPPTARSCCPPSGACRECGRPGSPAPELIPSEPGSMPAAPVPRRVSLSLLQNASSIAGSTARGSGCAALV